MSDLTVSTMSGAVRGKAVDGVRRWLGIPYARAERFAAPQPVAAWERVRDATAFAAQCPQMYGSNARRARLAPPGFSENCLPLNIYVPEGGEDVGRKPVYVWIHGGAFVAGSGNPYDGSAMAREGDVVVVTINYRLGVLGFVNFGEALGLPDIPSNLGIRDQIAALEWVRDNIAGFGGDPARVTIGGQSAGSMSVSLLMHAQRAWPLFRGAIMQSGAVSLIHSREKSLSIARRYAQLLGVDQGDRETLRTMDLRRLFEAQGQVDAENANTIPAAPWFDGDLLPDSFEKVRMRSTPPVPLLAGATREEIRLFELIPGDILPTKWPQLEARLEKQLGAEHAARILAAYPRTKAGRRALASDLTFSMPTRNFAERHANHSPTWYYRFDYGHPVAGATHGLDLLFTWPLRGLRAALARGGKMAGKRAALGKRMMGHYAHFVRHGAPGPDWPAYTPGQRAVMVFGLEDRVEANPEAERFAAWEGRDAGPRMDCGKSDPPPPAGGQGSLLQLQMFPEPRRHHVERLARFGKVGIVEEGVAEAIPQLEVGGYASLDQRAVRGDRGAHFHRAGRGDEQGRREAPERFGRQDRRDHRVEHVGILEIAHAAIGRSRRECAEGAGEGLAVAAPAPVGRSAEDADRGGERKLFLDERGHGLRGEQSARRAAEHRDVLRPVGLEQLAIDRDDVFGGRGVFVLGALAIGDAEDLDLRQPGERNRFDHPSAARDAHDEAAAGQVEQDLALVCRGHAGIGRGIDRAHAGDGRLTRGDAVHFL